MHRDVFSAGTSHYGVADCELLAQETHKFESRYLDLLIGPYPQDKKTYEERSAINALDGFSAPVMFFQVGSFVAGCRARPSASMVLMPFQHLVVAGTRKHT